MKQTQEVDASDEIFRFDEDKHREETNLEPWIADPTHFKKTKISAVAVLKMVCACVCVFSPLSPLVQRLHSTDFGLCFLATHQHVLALT